MEKAIFQDENDNVIFEVTDLKNFFVPKTGDFVIGNKRFMTVTSITYDYQDKTIEIEVELS